VIPVKESEVASPSEMMAVGDSANGGLDFMRQDLNYLEKRGASARHQGKLNVVFCDVHVESPTLQFLFTDTSDEALARWNRDHLPHREKLSP
jgi:prepilin-type processing-associated H-X9-DG protein